MKEKILAMLVILALLPMPIYAYAQNSPATYSIRYAILTDLTYSVTLSPGQIGMNFTGSPGAAWSSVDANGQDSTTPWAKINNTGDLPRNFTIAVSSDNPANIILRESNTYTMTGAIQISKTPQIIVGGNDLLPGTELNVFVKADYSSVPIGTNQVFTNTGTIRNYIPTLSSISISYTPSGTIYTGDVRTFAATGLDQYGVITSISTPVTWASSNTAAGAIDTNGIFTAAGTGSTNVTATSGSIVGYKIVVVQAGY